MAILPPVRRVRIESGDSPATARVLIGGEDVSNSVLAVSWSLKAGDMPTATVTFVGVEIAADADVAEDEIVGMMADRHITRKQWERLREAAPNLVAAIEAARPVVARERVVNRDSEQAV